MERCPFSSQDGNHYDNLCKYLTSQKSDSDTSQKISDKLFFILPLCIYPVEKTHYYTIGYLPAVLWEIVSQYGKDREYE